MPLLEGWHEKNKLNENIKKQYNFKKVTLSQNDKTVTPTKLKQKSKKCQPAEGGTQDLIQTWCAPLRGLARKNQKNKLNGKIKKQYNSNKVTLSQKDKPVTTSKLKQKSKKCQPAEGGTQDLIQTWCAPLRGLARKNKKNKLNEKNKIQKKYRKSSLNRQKKHQNTKTKKCQPAEGGTQDLIQTWCAPLRGLARTKQKNKLNEKQKENKKYYTKVTLMKNDETIKTKTKKCQPAAWDAQDLIQTWRVPHSRLARKKNKNKLNEKSKTTKKMLLKLQPTGRNRASYLSRKKINKNKKMENGNGKTQKAIKIVQWNLGAKRWENKIDIIKHLIEDFDPDVACISEANLYTEVEDHLRIIPGYKLVTADTMTVMKYSRIVVLVKNEINFKIEREYMDSVTASIWLSLPRRGKKKVMIGAIYREQHLLRVGTPNNTDNPNDQEARWRVVLDQWARASRGTESYIIGDLNLDYLKWDDPDARQKKMVESTKLVIETIGFFQLVEGQTRAWKNQEDSCLDHIWTNFPGKILQVRNVVRAISDHNVIECSVRIKGKLGQTQEIQKRKRKNYSEVRYKNSIKNIDWSTMYETDDIDDAYEIFEKQVEKCIETESPMKVIQPKKIFKEWMDVETLNMVRDRDAAREKARQSQLDEDWIQYKVCRNKCTLAVRSMKKKHLAGIYLDIEKNNDTKSLYSLTKNHLGWNTGGPPQSFIIEGKTVSAPSEMAEAQLKYFNNKVEKLISELPQKTEDPLKLLKTRM